MTIQGTPVTAAAAQMCHICLTSTVAHFIHYSKSSTLVNQKECYFTVLHTTSQNRATVISEHVHMFV